MAKEHEERGEMPMHKAHHGGKESFGKGKHRGGLIHKGAHHEKMGKHHKGSKKY